jgi:hypothetical protein
MKQPSQPALSRLMPRILAYSLADLFGLFCVVIGIGGLLDKPMMILANFPRSTAEAYVCAAGGIVLMLWAMSRMVREVRQLRNLSSGKNP